MQECMQNFGLKSVIVLQRRAGRERHVSKDHAGKISFRCGLCRDVFETIQRMRLHRKEVHFGKDVSETQKKRKYLKNEQQQVRIPSNNLRRNKKGLK